MSEKDLKQGFWNDTDEILERCAQELGDYLGITKDIYAMRAIHYLLRRVYDYAFRWGYLVGRKECENYENANN